MFFGATSFAAAPFAGVGVVNITVQPTGNRINIAIGNTNVELVTQVPVTGNQINLATNTVDVINWNQIIPGATGVWNQIVPGATGVWNQKVPGATGIWIPIDPDNP